MSKMPDNYEAAKAWAIERLGKRVYRPIICECDVCMKIVKTGLIVEDKVHAGYLADCAMEMGFRYQDEPMQ